MNFKKVHSTTTMTERGRRRWYATMREKERKIGEMSEAKSLLSAQCSPQQEFCWESEQRLNFSELFIRKNNEDEKAG